MLRSLNEIRGYRIAAKDGHIGTAHDFLVDDMSWIVRWIVVDTGSFLPGKKVLVPPELVRRADWSSKTFELRLTKQQIEESPPLAHDRPVSRQHEAALLSHIGLEPYWLAGPHGGTVTPPPATEHPADDFDRKKASDEGGDPHLRSCREVTGYRIRATDDTIGDVRDFIANDTSWQVVWLVVDTGTWLPGRKVILALPWIERIDWNESAVHVDIACEDVKRSPEFDPTQPINREYEEILFDYYGRPRYWERVRSQPTGR